MGKVRLMEPREGESVGAWLQARRRQFERDTGQPLRFMVPFTRQEILLGLACMLQLGFLLGYFLALEVFDRFLCAP